MNPFFSFDDDEFFSDLLLMGAASSGGSVVQETATGNPLTFLTDLARPLKSLLIPFTPVQSGTGDPSPQNIRSIIPWDGLSVVQNSENQLEILNIASNTFKQGIQFDVMKDSSNKVRAFHIYGKADNNNVFQNLNYVSLETLSFEAGEYEVGGFGIGDGIALRVYSKDANNADVLLYNSEIGNTAFTVPSDYKSCWMRIQITTQDDVDAILYPVVVKKGDRITETDISFPSPVYGGEHEAVSGKLMSFYALLTKNTAEMNNNEDYPGWKNSGVENIVGTGVNALISNVLTNVSPVSGLSVGANTAYGSDVLYLNKSYFNKTQSEWKALAIDIQILVPLATPQEIQLTPAQITALVGDNTIWSDADGSMTAVYLKKG